MKLGTRGAALLALALVSPVAFAKKDKKKKGEPAPVLVGWQTQEGWAGECYFPPAWGTMTDSERRQGRSDALDAMVKQWGGGKGDGVDFGEDLVEDIETVLLGRPEAVERVAVDNLEQCKKVMAGADSAAWRTWVKSLPGTLTEGECKGPPLDYQMFDYLSIGNDWQRPLSICKDDRIHITGTVKDKYRITEDGPWITVEGDLDQSAVGTDLPCNTEGCFRGQLIMRFQADSGWEQIIPVGAYAAFTAPEHGTIMYRINDDTFHDNSWYKSRGIEDHTAIEVGPGE